MGKDENKREKTFPGPCPFCGASPEMYADMHYGWPKTQTQVCCRNPECVVQPRTPMMVYDMAVREWNRRSDKTVRRLQGRVDELEYAIRACADFLDSCKPYLAPASVSLRLRRALGEEE